MKSYIEKLKDPRWNEKRNEIFKRDKWKCTECGSEDGKLNAHHKKYTGEPWEASNEDLITLCSMCHTFIHIDFDWSGHVEAVRIRLYNELKDELNLPPYEEMWRVKKKL